MNNDTVTRFSLRIMAASATPYPIVMLQEKNSKDIAAVIYGWLEKSVMAAR